MHACFSMLIAGCAALALPTAAQPVTPQGQVATVPAPTATAAAPKAVAVVTAAGSDARAAARTPGTTRVTAAGSVIILADGIVANAAFAQVLPPTHGFAYER